MTAQMLTLFRILRAIQIMQVEILPRIFQLEITNM